jgi:hypothetical protein
LSRQCRTTEKRQDAKETYDWNIKTIDLLSDITAVLSKAIMEWKRFNAPNGDLAYFSDLESFPNMSRSHIIKWLVAIKRTFEELENLQEDLLALEKACSNDAEAVGHSTLPDTHLLRALAQTLVER